jgi:hypothetical protein
MDAKKVKRNKKSCLTQSIFFADEKCRFLSQKRRICAFGFNSVVPQNDFMDWE